MISKACLVGAYQSKLEDIARYDDVDLVVIVPPVWNDPAGPVHLERSHLEGYRLLVEPMRFNGDFHLHYYPGLKKRVRQIRPDIIHIDEEPYNLATWLAWRQARAAGAKSLFFSWQNIGRRYPLPFRYMEDQVLQGVDYALMGNHEAALVWQKKGYRGPWSIIPQFGVNADRYSPQRRRAPGRDFVIGSANRRLVPEKGVDLLLRAAATLPGVWRLHIAGGGPERPALQALADELAISERVHFDGEISSAQMPSYLGELDVLVLASRTLPTWKEQFGRVLVEAMACGVPVVGSDSGEIPNVIGPAGLIFPEDDSDALGQCLLRLMRSGELQESLRTAGRQRVMDHFTQAQVAAETVAVYRQMMSYV